MAEDTAIARFVPQLPIEVWQLVMDTVCDATNYETFYSNQTDYRSWALVSRAWALCAQTVLFRAVELVDSPRLHQLVALLDAAPHLAPYVRTLRVYTRNLHTRDNPFALLPTIPHGRLPNLKSILLTRITEQDIWHPHAQHQPSSKELAYMPLDPSPHFPMQLSAHFASVSELFLSYVTFETFDALAQVLHAFGNLRLLSCLEVRWCELGPVPECLEGGDGKEAFLPKLEDLTIAYMDMHGAERLLSALGRSAALKELYVDCPHYNPLGFWNDLPSVDPATGAPLGIDLRAFPELASLWLALPYPRYSCKDLPEIVAALLRSWTPTPTAADSDPAARRPKRKLTLTPSYESDFARFEFADVLRALGPVIEEVLCEEEESEARKDACGGAEREAEEGVAVEVCVVDKEEKRDWWRGEARASFARLSARGRIEVSFEKSFWPEAHWQDYAELREPSVVQHTLEAGGDGGGGEEQGHAHEDRAFGSEQPGVQVMPPSTPPPRQRSTRFGHLRPIKRALKVVRRSLSKLKLFPRRFPWRRKDASSDALGT